MPRKPRDEKDDYTTREIVASGDIQLDEIQFVVPASDSQGHSVRIWLWMPQGLKNQIDMILASKLWPFRTEPDVIRYFIMAGFRHLELTAPLPYPTILGTLEMMRQIMVDEVYSIGVLEGIEKLEEIYHDHIKARRFEEARDLVSRNVQAAEGMPEGLLKKRVLATLDEKFAGIHSDFPMNMSSGVDGS